MFLVNKYMFRACNDLGRWGHPPIACLVGGVPTAHLSRIIISIGARRFFTGGGMLARTGGEKSIKIDLVSLSTSWFSAPKELSFFSEI